MVGGGAVGVDSADVGAGVDALLLLADAVGRALGVHVTLGLAVGRLAHKAGQARALLLVAVDHPALGVGPAGRGRAGLLGRGRLLDLDAAEEGVARVARLALADRLVLHHLAGGVGAARPNAGVRALLPDAGLVRPAVGGDEALGPAVGRLAVVARGAAAHHARAEDLADGVGPALRAGAAEPADGGRGRPGGNCIKLGLPGKSILGDYFQENRTSSTGWGIWSYSWVGLT